MKVKDMNTGASGKVIIKGGKKGRRKEADFTCSGVVVRNHQQQYLLIQMGDSCKMKSLGEGTRVRETIQA